MPAEPAAARAPVAVIGGTGWLGRQLVPALAATGRQVLVLARNEPAHPLAADARHSFLRFDLSTSKPADTARLLAGAGVGLVVNATDAANATDGWDRSEAEFARTNVRGVESLLSALREIPRPVRLVHLGTVHEYGPVPRGTVVDETTVPQPAHAYARTKLAGSDAVLDAARAGQVEAVVLRLTSVSGPHPSPASFLGKLLHGLCEATVEDPAVFRVTDATRDFVDVEDVADAVVRAGDADLSGRAVNIGSGAATRIGEVVSVLREVSGLPDAAVRVERAEAGRGLGGDWMHADVRLAARLLGWRPMTSLRQSLEAMWKHSSCPGACRTRTLGTQSTR
ncbi:NAD-dependent epimerase/dehydratase family protein [Streptomyces sp. NPDC060006]|uniref:NAD-dependent epimerase/dehydratase family protein n=1 Tax=unclassified Streptomyces TaxID=2593676 RepID=UPI0036934FD0